MNDCYRIDFFYLFKFFLLRYFFFLFQLFIYFIIFFFILFCFLVLFYSLFYFLFYSHTFFISILNITENFPNKPLNSSQSHKYASNIVVFCMATDKPKDWIYKDNIHYKTSANYKSSRKTQNTGTILFSPEKRRKKTTYFVGTHQNHSLRWF